MDIYLDFEATQFKENIIAIGASCTNGSFDCLVRPPKNDKITKFITKLTGITPEMAKNALSLEEAFLDLWTWVCNVSENNPTFFHVFGNMDKKFLQKAVSHCEVAGIKTFIENLSESLIDDSKKVCQYFHTKTVGVYKALRYFESDLPEQDHDPLNDAIALKNLMFHINYAKPLEECPFEERQPQIQKEKSITQSINAKISAKRKKKPAQHFETFEKACNWAYEQILIVNPEAKKTTIEKNIKKAIQQETKYNGYLWKEIK